MFIVVQGRRWYGCFDDFDEAHAEAKRLEGCVLCFCPDDGNWQVFDYQPTLWYS